VSPDARGLANAALSPLASPLLPKGKAGAKGEEEQLCKTDPDTKRAALQRLGIKPLNFVKPTELVKPHLS
jgi:hypothetical protein